MLSVTRGLVEKLVKNAMPSGAVVMWSGSSSNIPNGWLLCDGTNGTPNLIGRFVKGATSSGTTGGSSTHTHSTGSHTLSINEIPSHDHSWRKLNASGGNGGGYGISSSSCTCTTMTSNGAIGTTGGSQPHNHGNTNSSSNEPPYFEICYIMKG